jgi:hypothetical protein
MKKGAGDGEGRHRREAGRRIEACVVLAAATGSDDAERGEWEEQVESFHLPPRLEQTSKQGEAFGYVTVTFGSCARR